MKALIITGTPGTGKTTLAKKLAQQLGLHLVNIDKIITKLKPRYDAKRRCLIVDQAKLAAQLEKMIQKSKEHLVIASHLSHYVSPKKAVCIVTKCSLKKLQQRLKRRHYSEAKIRENLDAEIFDVCLCEARELGHSPIIVRTDKPLTKKLIERIKNELKLS